MPKKRNNNRRNEHLKRVCEEVAEMYTHRDVASYDEIYAVLRAKYGGELPSTPNILRLCVRHDRTPPPVLRKGEKFSDFLNKVIQRQEERDAQFHGKWKIRNPDGSIRTVKGRDLSKKSYALTMYNERWKRQWEACSIKPIPEKYKEYDYRLGEYYGAWADYECGR